MLQRRALIWSTRKCSIYLSFILLYIGIANGDSAGSPVVSTIQSRLPTALRTNRNKNNNRHPTNTIQRDSGAIQRDSKPFGSVESNSKLLTPIGARRLLVLCSLVYGSTYSTTKFLQEQLPSQLINVIRFMFGSSLFLWDIIQFRGSIDVIIVGLELGLWCGLGFIAQCAVLTISSASKAALFTSLGVIIPPILDFIASILSAEDGNKSRNSAVLKNEHLTVKEPQLVSTVMKILHSVCRSPYFSPILAILGASVIEWGGIEQPTYSDFLLLMPPLCFAMCLWRSGRIAVKHPQHTNTITGIMLFTTALMAAVWASFNGQLPGNKTEWIDLWNVLVSDVRWIPMLLYNSFISTGWTAITEQRALKVLSSSDTTLIYSLEPVFASIFASWFLNELLGWNTLLGATLIVLACGLHGF